MENWLHVKQSVLGYNKMLLLNNRRCKRHLQRPLGGGCLNFVENIECYHQMLIDMKEEYGRNVETFVKATKWNLIHMHLACILATS